RRKGGTRPVGRTGGRRGVALGRPPAGSPDAENPRHPDESGLPGVPTTGERRAVRFGASSVDAAGLPSPSFPRRAVRGSGAPGPGARSAAASDLAAGSPGTEPSRRARPPKGVPFGGPAPPVRGPLDRRRVRHTIVRQGGRRKDLVDNCKLVQHSNIRRRPHGRRFPLRARLRNAHRRQRLPVCNNFNPRATGGFPPLTPGVFHARAPLVHSGRGETLARGGRREGLGTAAGSVAGAAWRPIREPSRVRPLSTPAVDPLPSPASGPPRFAPAVGPPE